MKNRLQIRYHIPNILPTREEAIKYLNEFFMYSGTSLSAEPLVLLYNDTPLDIDKGITEKERLKTANIILAIGKGGDGNDIRNNEDYFIIDFAKHEEEILSLTKRIDDIDVIIPILKESIANYINTQVSDTKESLVNYIDNEITNVNESLKVTKDYFEKVIEENELVTATSLNDLNNRITNKSEIGHNHISSEITDSVSQLSGITEETAELIQGKVINEVRNVIIENELITSKALNVLNSKIESETSRATEIENELQKNIADVNSELSLEIQKNKIISNEGSVKINSIDENGTDIEVNIDRRTIKSNEDGVLFVDANEILQYSGENAILIANDKTKKVSLKINTNDKMLINDENGLLSTIELKWVKGNVDGNKNEFQLIGKNNEIISRIDIEEFLKDVKIETILLNADDATNPYLIFKFDGNKEDIRVDLSSIISRYYNGKGLSLNDNTFEIKIDNTSEEYLTVSNDGIKLNGINEIKNELEKVYNIIGNPDDEDNSLVSRVDKLEENTTELQQLVGDTSVKNQIEETINSYKNNCDTVNVSEKNKNFLIIENENDIKALAVRSIDTDSTILQEDIVIAGLTNDLGGYSNGMTISSGTSIYEILKTILCKEVYPDIKITYGKVTVSLKDLIISINNYEEYKEVGTLITLNSCETNGVNINKTDTIVSGMTWGYSTSNNNIKEVDEDSITKSCEHSVKDNSYTISCSLTGFTADTEKYPQTTPETATGAGKASLSVSDIGCIIEGDNIIKFNATGPSYSYSAETISIYYCSNLGKTNEDSFINVETKDDISKPNKPTSKTIKGRYKYFLGCLDKKFSDEITSDDIRSLNIRSGWLTPNDTTIILDTNETLTTDAGKSLFIACPKTYKLNRIYYSIGTVFTELEEKIINVRTGEIDTEYNVYVYNISDPVGNVEIKDVTIVPND